MDEYEKMITEMREIILSSPVLTIPVVCSFVSICFRVFREEMNKNDHSNFP